MAPCVLEMHVAGHKAILWPQSVMAGLFYSASLATGGHFLPLSTHLQPKQLVAPVTVFSWPLIVDCVAGSGSEGRRHW